MNGLENNCFTDESTFEEKFRAKGKLNLQHGPADYCFKRRRRGKFRADSESNPKNGLENYCFMNGLTCVEKCRPRDKLNLQSGLADYCFKRRRRGKFRADDESNPKDESNLQSGLANYGFTR